MLATSKHHTAFVGAVTQATSQTLAQQHVLALPRCIKKLKGVVWAHDAKLL